VNILYEQTGFPVLQNRVYETVHDARNCIRGDIKIVENQQTGMIYNSAFRPELMIYDSNYNNEQSLSFQFRNHLNSVAEIIDKYLGKEKIIEVGCGKGFFLEMLLKRGFDVTGFDSTYDGDNPRVKKKHFEPCVMSTSKGLVLRHVLEHIENPVDFLFQLKLANSGKGLIYIEVPCFDWILRKRAWFDVFYEHVNYFRLCDFDKIFGRIVSKGRLFGDQYLYVVADLESLQKPEYKESDRVIFPPDFLASLTAQHSTAQHSTAQHSTAQHSTEKTVVWGGASKGVVFSLIRARNGSPVDFVVDINKVKQDKFLPVTGLKVKSPLVAMQELKPGSTIYVMNSNYLDEIKTMSNNLFNYIGIDQ
jgi:SAM-dependent methyltransferase